MTEDHFWELIGEHVVVDDALEVDASALEEALAALTPEEIVSFDEIFTGLDRASYSWALWGAAYLINGGCSDDGFDYFRGWLIGQGRSIFEEALRDPDSLADRSEAEVECEDILSVAQDAYLVSTDTDMPDRERPPLPDLDEGWDFDDQEEMKRRYPRLYARYCEG